MAMVLRSIYLDPTLDAELASRAEVEGTTKAELMRRFLIAGLARPAERFSGYATEAPFVHAQRGAARAGEPRAAYAAGSAAAYAAGSTAYAAEPRAAYAAESGSEAWESYNAAFSHPVAEHDDELVHLLLDEEDIATSAPVEPPAARVPDAPPARVARGTQKPPFAQRTGRAVREPPPRAAERGQGDAPPARAEPPQRTASPVRRPGKAAAPAATVRAAAPRKPREP